MIVSPWLQSAHVIDWILAAMLVELLVLAVLRRKTHKGLATPALVVNMVAGAALLMALRAALTSPGATAIVEGWLVVALAAHLADLKFRWRVNP